MAPLDSRLNVATLYSSAVSNHHPTDLTRGRPPASKKRTLGERVHRVLCMAAALFAFYGCASSIPPPPADYAITNITVIDAEQGARAGQTVYVSGDKIVRVAGADEDASPAQWSVDGTNRYLIPGLWDMHVHITYEPELTAAMPDLFLSYGITSVRDTGGLLKNLLPEISRWRAPGARAPRIVFSGPLLDGGIVVYDGGDVPEIGTANATPDMARANIERLKRAGVDFVKTYELITPQVFRALTTAARDADLPIASHVPLMMLAEDAGPLVDSMEHLRNVELACSSEAEALLEARTQTMSASSNQKGISLRSTIHSEQRPLAFASYDKARCDRVIASLAKTIQVPTLRLNTSALYQPYDRPDWKDHVARLPVAAQQRWLDNGAAWSKRRPSLPPESGQYSLDLIGRMHAAGVPIGAGTDTPIGSALPGYSLHTELERLVEAGLTPLEALRSATVIPAKFVRRDSEMGTIAEGQLADLVILDRNPLQDIRNTRRINTVISKGEIVYTADSDD